MLVIFSWEYLDERVRLQAWLLSSSKGNLVWNSFIPREFQVLNDDHIGVPRVVGSVFRSFDCPIAKIWSLAERMWYPYTTQIDS